MSDLPVTLPAELQPAFVAAFDPPGKLVAAIEALGPVGDRDVVVVDADGGPIVEGLSKVGARLRHVDASQPLRLPLGDGSADVVLGLWSTFRGVEPGELREVDRALRPGGRHLVVHDYGRDDVSRLHGDAPERPEYGAWSHRLGPFLTGGFRLRVVHCFWEFESLADVASFLGAAFGGAGQAVAATLRRPRLSYNAAIYHRTRP